ncbi:two component, sigma54 specific, transcriptional regulator, Fis family [Malonomonas rubra DSM 5091]|uniref:Two component, sigma54 specific, transcriptional regulator, Fis family n=1 Tax=Malonomonas rubra DSM 5091 TaxID=1122189 RepID=A0A1M6D8C0_MALRU|nr:sigma-54 dependent transcriptional regulator [Malonomonas rubra]SHI69400.1 two component, sigma54 specific, transcriptional regulator, Fis family [Malonomonas rubra DSM 5091]
MIRENKQVRILVVDDEASMREFLSIMLQREGYRVDEAVNGEEALKKLDDVKYDLLISDIKMPRMTGIELLREIRQQEVDLTVIMITAFSSTEEAVEAMKLGAYDYITKPFKNDEIRLVIKKALERNHLQSENIQLKKKLDERFSFKQLVGNSSAMKNLVALLERVAPSQANVLITGESGTGKELVAKALHLNSERKQQAFVPINCGAIPENLLESELFGHEKGAFTGAERRKDGLFEAANGGTLFLDEIGELPMAMQVKLLRVLQEREYRRVGGTKNNPLDIRLLAATNRNLEDAVRDGDFREDLYYRLNVVQVDLPPLRERSTDVPLLIDYFYHVRTGDSHLPIAADALPYLLEYSWPGNIRELENFVERAIVLGAGETLTVEQLPPQIKKRSDGPCSVLEELPEAGFNLEEWLADIEKTMLEKALQKSNGVKKDAADLLGISFRSFRYRLSKLNMGDEE